VTASRRGQVVQAVVLGLIASGFLGVGVFLLVRQHSGDQVSATVSWCDVRRRSETCHGTWTVAGRVHSGVVEGATADDIGSRVDGRAHGNRAYVPSWRVPAVLLAVGLLWPLVLVATQVRRRTDRG
jgi:hypothetical protein